MGLPNFLNKAALSAAQILQNFDREEFEETLLSNTIGIAYDDQATFPEARKTLTLSIRLLARLYPNISILDVTNKNSEITKELIKTAREINPEINIENSSEPTISIFIGNTNFEMKSRVFFIGSNGWIAHFSPDQPVGSGSTNNPFGSGSAACFGAANIFRAVFEKQLPYSKIDDPFSISMFNYKLNSEENPKIPPVNLGETYLIGLGAIGNSTVWAISQLPSLNGNLHLIDGEKIELSNLQRYLLSNQENVDQFKVNVAKEYLKNSQINVKPVPSNWDEFLKLKGNWLIDRVAVGVDSAKDRIAIQSSLPKKVFNAWTQSEDLGVSRHQDFLNSACLACLYLPKKEHKSYSQEVSDALRLSDNERLIRGYLGSNKLVDDCLLELISESMKISFEEIKHFKGLPIDTLYSQGICGGEILKLSGIPENLSEVDAPVVFQSALAGLMLAAEVIIDAGKIERNLDATITRFNLIRSMSKYPLSVIETKDISGRCFCNDSIYRNVYASKYNIKLVSSHEEE